MACPFDGIRFRYSLSYDWNSTRCDVLYALKLPLTFSPMLIKVQNTINEAFLRRLITYALNIVKTYDAPPCRIGL
ncbi:uncharacterized protein BYT42DRAFT_495872 [Radiomyces spectabilis]|uniref:uncharacterized protein n=1 Tax=Radiomyces spectabilis TaxID=64574 RepID=UPI00221F1A1D|nr:uncharacterized protein BYT42DRAFT_495872 [Radiomyces spectabilis]KAI8379364.1 hypothetical protein BYT42DRAFT_495872 [Radiomyces spectabilis]